MPDDVADATAEEDATLVVLARSAAARGAGGGAGRGAAVRDGAGRTYAAAAVALEGLELTAVQAVVAAALSSGVGRLDSVAVWGAELTAADRALLDEVGPVRVATPGATPVAGSGTTTTAGTGG